MRGTAIIKKGRIIEATAANLRQKERNARTREPLGQVEHQRQRAILLTISGRSRRSGATSAQQVPDRQRLA